MSSIKFEIHCYPLHFQLRYLWPDASYYGNPPPVITTVTAIRQYSCGVGPHYSYLAYVMCHPHHHHYKSHLRNRQSVPTATG